MNRTRIVLSVFLCTLFWCLPIHGQAPTFSGSGWIAVLGAQQNGNIYDQICWSGPGDLTASPVPGHILRVSFIDMADNIVQVEMSGAGELSLFHSTTAQSGIVQPTGYLQNLTGFAGYEKTCPGILLRFTDATTHFTIYSVGRSNGNPALFDASHNGGLDVGPFKGHIANVGNIRITGSSIAGIHTGNARVGSLTCTAPITGRFALNDIYDFGASSDPFLSLSPYSTMAQDGGCILLCGGNVSASGDLRVQNVLKIRSQSGSDSNGNLLPQLVIRHNFIDFVTRQLVFPTIFY